MAIYNAHPGNAGRMALIGLMTLLVIAWQPAMIPTAAAAGEDFQGLLEETLKDLWAGREPCPELDRRQQTLKAALASGAMTKAELECVMEATISSILNNHQTTRYVLKTFPDRFNAIFSPSMKWEEFRTILWRSLTSVIREEDPVSIKVGTLAPQGTPWLNVLESSLFPEISKLSGGKVQFKVYSGGVMGEDTDILRKMDVGQLDGCGCTAIGALEASPNMSALLLPALFNNYEEVDYIFEKFREKLDRGFEERGYILVTLIDTGYFYIFSKHRVASLADVRKQKMYTWFGIVETTMFEELGINAMPVAVPEAVSTLSSGLFDTGPAAWFLGMQAYQYMNYYINPPLVYSPAAVVVSIHLKDKLQKQLGTTAVRTSNFQEILISEFKAIEPEWKRQIRNYEAKSLEAFETKCGMKAMALPPEDRELLEKAGHAVQRKLAGKVFPEDLIIDIRKALEEYRASH